MPDPWTFALLVATAYLTAAVSGTLGMAGGILLLTVFFLVGMPPAEAVPLHAVVQLASNTTRVVAFLRHVRWRSFAIYALCALPFPVVGLVLCDRLPHEWTKFALGLVVLWATWGRRGGAARLGEDTAIGIAGALSGTFGVVLGATGPLIAPFFLRPDWVRQRLIATKAVAQAFTHAHKLLAFGLLASWMLEHAWIHDSRIGSFALGGDLRVVLPLVAAVFFGTWTGKWVLGKLSEATFRRLYRTVLTLCAVRLVASPLLG